MKSKFLSLFCPKCVANLATSGTPNIGDLSDIGHSQKRIPAIDGLRAVAVLSVIIFHIFSPALPGGFTGVDVFFVISGYVVCGSLLRDPRDNFVTFITAFYARRIQRIYPALIVLLLVTGTMATLFIPNAWLVNGCSRIGLAAFFGLSNIAMILFGNSYFSPTAEFNVYAHTWSLGVEEQFYVVFPLLFFFILRAQSSRHKAYGLSPILLPALLGISFLFSIWETSARHDHAYYLLPSRFWELAVGACLCLAHQKRQLLPISRNQSTLLVSGGLIMIGISAFLAVPEYFPFPWAAGPVLGSACCIAGVVVPNGADVGNRILRSPAAVYIGRVSYSAYLWHWPVIVLLRWTSGINSGLSIAIALLSTLILSVASYHCVEVPIQQRSAFFKRHRLSVVAGGGGLMILCSAVFVLVVKSQPVIGLSVVSANPDIWSVPVFKNYGLIAGQEGKIWSGKHLFVIGDSHASAYSGILSRLNSEKGVSFYLGSSAGAHLGSLVRIMNDRDRALEAQLLVDVRKYAQPGDVVLLASLRVLRLSEQWENFDLQKVIEERDNAKAESNRIAAVLEGKKLIGELTQLGLVVVVTAPTPVFMSPPFRCSDWFNNSNPIGDRGFLIGRNFLLAHRSSAMRSIQEVRDDFPAVRVWDPLAILCPDMTCSAFDGAKPLFFDGDHLSEYGNQKLYPSFLAQLQQVWNEQQQ